MNGLRRRIAAAVTALGLAVPAAAETLTVWSHWADEPAKVAFVEAAAAAFEADTPGVEVEISWFQKRELYAALKTALFAGRGPDVFYAEPDQTEYIDNDLLLDLTRHVDWSRMEDWARAVWSRGAGTYGLPLEAWTVETYVNVGLARELGLHPLDRHAEGAAFVDMVARARAAGVVPMAQGVGDRDYPGAFLTHEILLKALGAQDYRRLLDGDGVSWGDPPVRAALRYAEAILSAGAFPESFATLRLGEAHRHFHTAPGALLFQMGSFYPSRAFRPPGQGGQPEGFELGLVRAPVPPDAACPRCKTIAVGGSFVVNARSPRAETGARFLASLATPEAGARWIETVLVQTGIRVPGPRIGGPHADYFAALQRENADAEMFFGLPMQRLKGARRDAFTQLVNHAFPAGLIGADELADRMTAVYE